MIYNIGIIGLGYVGLQLAVTFGKRFNTIGIDKSPKKIDQLNNYVDITNEVSKSSLKSAKFLKYTCVYSYLKNCNYMIVAVPTPINLKKKPDLKLLKDACKSISEYLSKNTIIIFNQQFILVTEDICVPLIEKYSSLKWKKDFNIGYSPERINPGDKTKSLPNIEKVVSGDTVSIRNKISKLYSQVINKKIYLASSIKVAEMAKVLENTQRDVNIALMNEVAIICNKLAIDTKDVIDTADTKWNFIKFTPGLVGGHCIGVDPYYLTFKAKKIGYKPKVILSGRNLNDSIPKYICKRVVNFSKNLSKDCKINLLGFTFKENCSDIRNSKVYDIYECLSKNNLDIRIHDPVANIQEVKSLYNIDLVPWDKLHNKANILLLAVKHNYYNKINLQQLKDKVCAGGIIYDIKSVFSKEKIKKLGFKYYNF